MQIILAFVAGLAAGSIPLGLFVWHTLRDRDRLNTELTGERNDRVRLTAELDAERRAGGERLQAERAAGAERLAAEQRAASEKIAAYEQAETTLREAFSALSAEALKNNTTQFLDIARETLGKARQEAKGDLDQRREAIGNLVNPLAETLKKYEKEIQAMEQRRSEAYGTLTQQVHSLIDTQRQLERETGKLVDALKKPHVRGRWGEIQLRNIVEYAGMQDHCDFSEQVHLRTDDGSLRPDMTVRIPGGLHIVVDAKTPLDAYLDAVNATDEAERADHFKQHARNVRSHINRLSAKEYWKQFDSTPDFVVMFIPGEPFYLAALQEDPTLLDAGVEKRVILAAPTTLIALLKVTAYGWQQEQLAENARRISDLGRELYERVSILSGHMQTLGKHITNSVNAYNKTVGALESRVLVTARRFNEMGLGRDKEIPELEPVDSLTRSLRAPELLSGDDGDND